MTKNCYQTIKTGTVIRLTDELARIRLAKMCLEDMRAYGAELAVLINQEWNRRHQEELKDAEDEEQERCNE
jgi:hypothetical protein